MFNIVSPKVITSRLDASYYQREFIDNQDVLERLGSVELSELIDVSRSCYGVLPKSSDYADEGVPLIRGGDLSFGHIASPTITVPKSYKCPKSSVEAGNVLILIKGACIDAPEGVGLVKENESGCLFNGSCYKLVFKKPDVDAPFFLAYSQSKYFLRQKKRSVANTGISYNDQETINRYLIARFTEAVKKYIGEKVCQADRLFERASLLNRAPVIVEALLNGFVSEQDLTNAQQALEKGDDVFDQVILANLGVSGRGIDSDDRFGDLLQKCKWESVDTEREGCHVNRISSSVIEDFLTAQTYRPEVSRAYERIVERDHENLQNLCVEPIRQGATPKFSEQGSRCLKSKQTREMIIDDIGFETVDPSDPDNKAIVRLISGDVVITRQGAGTVGRASLFLGDAETYITDSLFIVRADDKKVDSGYLVAYLRSYTGKRLVEKGVYGSTGQLNLSANHVRNIPVASLDLLAQKYIGDKVRLVDSLKTYQRSLIRASKSIVEALIDGQLTEQQLTDAKRALDANDNSLDRNILSRLKTDGIDGEGKPLFPDLDQLYELLEQAGKELEA